jgi:tRNA threonylcarbamoyladenosine biosynthesis protein TsaB
MNLLAIETATEGCSAALLCGSALRERFEVAPRRHAELILPMIDELLAEAGIAKSQLDAIAVGRGPGAFTGVRLAIAVAQGIALALDRPIVPVSSLAALALSAVGEGKGVAPPGATVSSPVCDAPPIPGTHVLAAIDARMGEIYAGAFARDDDGLLSPLGDEQLCEAGALMLPDAVSWTVAGTGWRAYPDAIGTRLGRAPAQAYPDALPHATAVARLGARDFARGLGIDAARAQPKYLRDKVALTLAEQGKAAQR